MKKISIALLGLFTLVACSEDAYQEADRKTEAAVVDNNADGGIKPLTVSPGYYNSPFYYFTSGLNKGFVTTYTNNTPLILELEPFGEDMHVQTFLSANGGTYPIVSTPPFDFNPISGGKFTINPGTIETNVDPGAPLSVDLLPYSNQQGSIAYDFGSFTANYRMLHYGKIYYFKYNVLNDHGNVIYTGYLKHQFFNDNHTHENVSTIDPDWQYVTTVGNIPAPYTPVVMYSVSQDEMCITNNRNYTTPLPSSALITDPTTLSTYTLSFTSDGTGINVDFN